jgi:hypothetical protein
MTPKTAAINVRHGGNEPAGQPVPPQGPTGTSSSSRPVDQVWSAIRPPRWLTDHRTATAVMRIADPAVGDHAPSHRLRPQAQNRPAGLSLTGTPQRPPSNPHHAR